MKQLAPDLANRIVQQVGWSSIEDSDSVMTKKEIEIALQYFDDDMLKLIEETYKNDVRKRIREGIDSPRAFMTLLRRVLKRHNVSVVYDRVVGPEGVYFIYRLIH
jgi:hypothetical protein